MTDEPLRHIVRPSLPWREADQTRCGRDMAELRPELTITFDEARALVDKHGKQRAAFMICMTCAQGTAPWREFDDDPIDRIEREAAPLSRYHRDPERRARFERELRAIALLVERHRDEFDQAIAALGSEDVVSLKDVRRSRRARR